MKTLKFFSVHVLVFTLVLPVISLASPSYEDEENIMGYDEIVDKLSQTRTPGYTANNDPFKNVKIHGGVGFVSSYISLQPPQGGRISGFLKGFEANFGIDLFTPNWVAEGAVRSFSEARIKSSDTDPAKTSLREFDLKVVYKPRLSRLLRLRAGAGLAARYLTFSQTLEEGRFRKKYNTPSSILLFGAIARISGNFSVETDLALRSAMIEETIEDSAIDAAIRLSARF